MERSEKPKIDYPFFAPIKVIGSEQELQAAAIAEIIHAHLGDGTASLPEGWEGLFRYSAQAKGAWISHTFWITLPNEHVEKPMREAIHKLPGVVMQL